MESVKSEEIPPPSSKWKLNLDEKFVPCLNSDRKKIGKPIENYWDTLIDTSLNHMSIRSSPLPYAEIGASFQQ